MLPVPHGAKVLHVDHVGEPFAQRSWLRAAVGRHETIGYVVPGLARVAEAGNPVVAVGSALHFGEALFYDGNARDVAFDVVLGVHDDAHGFQNVGNGLPEGGHVLFRRSGIGNGHFYGAGKLFPEFLPLRAGNVERVLDFMRIKARSRNVPVFLHEGHGAAYMQPASHRKRRRQRHRAASFRYGYGNLRRYVRLLSLFIRLRHENVGRFPHLEIKGKFCRNAVSLIHHAAFVSGNAHITMSPLPAARNRAAVCFLFRLRPVLQPAESPSDKAAQAPAPLRSCS